MLGLPEDIVKLVPYTPEWTQWFELEKAQIEAVIGEHILDVEHIGSTAIPGMMAKPIIDLSVGVKNFDGAFICVEPLVALGYEYLGENGIPRRHYFRRGEPKRTHHLHMVEVDSVDRERTLLFRDYLRQHPEVAQEYAALKDKLAHQFQHNRPSYMKGKTPFIDQVVTLARAEYAYLKERSLNTH